MPLDTVLACSLQDAQALAGRKKKKEVRAWPQSLSNSLIGCVQPLVFTDVAADSVSHPYLLRLAHANLQQAAIAAAKAREPK